MQIAIFAIGLARYFVFRSANNQKDQIQRTRKPAEYIVAKYETADGAKHSSILLCSGWWG
ncbi:hypothetical protein LLEC1_08125 [Akanthomyces lecanii]|uniref:Uncharacterized protein n=1 Tax=Cordyceps confragosa TaxID=2714763 RepID=A0A179IUI7_CORDF|nr:hypothetical protein LLEC1_08125 [Akanthomyces lecanii]